MDSYMVDVSNVSKKFKTYNVSGSNVRTYRSLFRRYFLKKALVNVSFRIKKGSIVALLGKNGSGKSTLVKILTGVLYPDKGIVKVDGLVPWEQRKEYAMRMGVVFSQHSALYPDLPPKDTFEYMRHLYAIPQKEYYERLKYLIKILDLHEVYTRQTRLLSFGERMKCNFVVAVLHNPDIVFLDEATVGIDLPSRYALRRAVMDMRDRLGTTFVIATHIVDDVEALAEGIVFIDQGEVIFDGTREEFDKTIGNKKHLELNMRNGMNFNPKKYGKVLEEHENYLKLEVDSSRIKSKIFESLFKNKNVIDYSVYSPGLGYIISKFYSKLGTRKRR